MASDRAIALDADQRAAREAILGGGNHVVLGAPGTGLTSTAIETFVAWSEQQPPESALLLVPTRQRAGELRDRLARRLDRTTGQVLVRTPASLAYAILRLRASHRGEPPPTLVSGPEQDTVLADLIAGHLAGEGTPIAWPDRIGPETLRLPAFRAELRDLLMRAAEAGLDGAGLDELGRRHDRPEWCAAGRLLTEYGDVMALGELTPDRGARYDAATIVDQAVLALRTWETELSADSRPRWSLVLHDDYQDATLATARLLVAIADGGARVSVLGDPDRGVQTFRGGQPALLDAATRAVGTVDGALSAAVNVLGTSFRHGPALRAAVASLTATLPVLGDDRRRLAAPGADPEPDQPVRHLLLPTASQEVAAIAQQLRIARLRQGVPWSQMAVIVRTGARVAEIRRGLRTAGIPLAAAIPDRPLREEPAVRPLLIALRCVIDGTVPTEAATALLLSPLGGLDAVSMRSLRRVLRQRDGARTPSEELVPHLLTPDRDPAVLADLPPRLHQAVATVAAVLDAGRRALADDPRGTEMALWAMWERTGLARQWQDRALAGGAAADRADADLDAVVTLFKAAEQFTDRTTGADPATFLAHLATQDFAADTLAARGEDSETVAVHTAASAAGGEWDLVVVAGLQEDAWPDLRIRDTLLGAQQLADITTARDSGLRRGEGREMAEMTEVLRAARADVLAGELRAFVAACSRARRTLLLTAVLDVDSRPSTFYEMLLPATDGAPSTGGLPPLASVTAALDLRGLVGELRAALHGPDDRAAAALRLLAHLRANGVDHADPDRWPDRLPPTSHTPAHDAARPVPISPSAVEKATSCPLHWVLSTAGGRKPSSQAQNVGNLIHEIAAGLPHGTIEELRHELDRRWHEIGLDDAWVSRTERARAEEMVRRLAAYLADHPEQVEVESDFDVEIEVDGGRARVRGRMDRVEHTPAGLRVVDLKTGASPPSMEQTARHAQLGSYQLAVEHGAFGEAEPQGGSLVYLGTGARGATMRHQSPLASDADPGWAHELIAQTVRTLTSGEFPAQQNPMCGYCQVRTSCPVQPEGGRVVPR